jgi:hypothetical protein
VGLGRAEAVRLQVPFGAAATDSLPDYKGRPVLLQPTRDDPQRVAGKRALQSQRFGAGALSHASISSGRVKMTGIALG